MKMNMNINDNDKQVAKIWDCTLWHLWSDNNFCVSVSGQ